MAFPGSPSNGDIYTTANGTIYTYDDTDNKWTIVGSSNPISDAAYGAGWDAVVDVAPSKNAVYDKISGMKVTIGLHMMDYLAIPHTGDWFGMIELNAAGESIGAHFFIDDSVDDSKDMLLTWVFTCDDNDASLAMIRNLGAQKTDRSEDYGLKNIDNNTGFNVVTTSNKTGRYQLVIANADFETNDILKIWITLNEGSGRRLYNYGLFITYYLA